MDPRPNEPAIEPGDGRPGEGRPGEGVPRTGDHPDPVSAPRTAGRLRLVLVVAACVLVLDLITKLVVVARLENETPLRLLGDWLVLRVIRNPGAAFSIGTGMTLLLTAIATVVVIFVVRQARKLHSTAWALTLGALLGGALGNLIDRVFRSPGVFRGHVVDWVAVQDFPVFNVADSAITLTAVAIVVLTLRGVPLERPAPPHATPDGTATHEAAPLPRDRPDGSDHG